MRNASIETIWSNDYDPKKEIMYKAQWGEGDFTLQDIHSINGKELPDADLAWASSPCTDLSLAGKREGLRNGKESSAFFGFTNLLQELGNRKPKVIVLENVTGLASSNSGQDLKTAIIEFNTLGYHVDALIIDAKLFLPQSRPRLFVIGTLNPPSDSDKDTTLRPKSVSWIHSDSDLKTFKLNLPEIISEEINNFSDLAENIPEEDARWWNKDKLDNFLSELSDVQRKRFTKFLNTDKKIFRTAYRRTRNGKPAWEIREQDLAGCLRTARGGSSKQAVIQFERGKYAIRWMTGKEYAILMGAPWYKIEGFTESQIQYAFGDAVAVPVVEWLSINVLRKLVEI